MDPSRSFEEVLAGLRTADNESAFRVFERYSQRLFKLAHSRLNRRLRTKLDPTDVVQSVFRSFFARCRDGQYELTNWDSLESLLVRVTLHKCRNVAAHFGTLRRDVGREDQPASGGEGEGTVWEFLDREPTPDEAACLRDALESAVRGLDEEDMAVVELRFQGLKAREISSQVALSEATVRRIIDRVARRLRQLLTDDRRA